MLRLAGLDIQVLSGPVSMHYLKPSRPGMPLVLLLGDLHEGMSTMTRQCDEEEGCYPIYSDSLLLALNELGGRYPVDFYVEYGKGDTVQFSKEVLFGYLKKKLYYCGETAYRSSFLYEEHCSTPNIRHHRADVRSFAGTVEDTARKIYDITPPYVGSTFTGDLTVKGLFSATLAPFQRAFDALNRAAAQGLPYSEVRDEVAREVYSLTLLPGSICAKQIRKTGLELRWEKMFYIVEESSVETVDEYMKAYRESPEDVEMVVSAFFNRRGWLVVTSEKYVYLINLISTILIFLNAAFVDLYMVARMLKYKDSRLSLGMFGAAHSKNIARFLEEEVGYSLEYSRENLSQRQLYITKDLDIDRDIALIEADGSSFLSRLSQERMSRERELKSIEEQLTPFAKELYDKIDLKARKLYSLRTSQLEVYAQEDAMKAHQMIQAYVSQLQQTWGLPYAQTLYLYECAIELIDFLVMEVCQNLYNPQQMQNMVVACIIASAKALSDNPIYDAIPFSFDRYLVQEMVTDIEVRTGYQLCRYTDARQLVDESAGEAIDPEETERVKRELIQRMKEKMEI